MRITERRLRSIIRSVIAENRYGTLPSGDESVKGMPHGGDPLNAVNPETGESEADRVLRVAKELEAKGERGLAHRLRAIADELKGVFKKHDVIN